MCVFEKTSREQQRKNNSRVRGGRRKIKARPDTLLGLLSNKQTKKPKINFHHGVDIVKVEILSITWGKKVFSLLHSKYDTTFCTNATIRKLHKAKPIVRECISFIYF